MVRCLECEVGKHGNCDGQGWNVDTDAPAACPCAERHHEPVEKAGTL